MATAKQLRAAREAGAAFEAEPRELIELDHARDAPSEFAEDEEPEQTSADRVAGMLQGASGDSLARVRVYRLKDGSLSYCKEYNCDQFEAGGLEMIRASFGAGNYEIRLYAKHPETGKFGIRARERIEIEADLSPTPVMLGGAPQAHNSEMAQLLTALLTEQRQMREALTQRPDPMASLKETMGMMVMMREAMGVNTSPQKSSIMEAVEAVRMLRSVSEEFGPAEKDKEPGMMGMASEILSIVKQSTAQAPAPQSLPQMAPITLPSDMQQAPVPGPVSDNQQDDDMILKLARDMAKMVEMAKAGTDPEEAGVFVYENLPDEFLVDLKADTWFPDLCKYAKEFSPYQDWLTKVRAVVLEELQVDEDDAQAAQSQQKPA